MVVETHTLCAFDLNLKPPPRSCATSISCIDKPKLYTQMLRSFEIPEPSDASEFDTSESPTARDRKCEGMTDPTVSASSLDATSPTSNGRECEGPVVSGGMIPRDKLEKLPSNAAMKVQKVYKSYRMLFYF